ncbi:Uncharacterised protein [Vibrio cholerae]|nr:Uncharacterised protein [Vibrio cholerae]
MCKRHWAWVNTRRNQTRNVRHVNKQVSTHFIGDFTHAFPIHDL